MVDAYEEETIFKTINVNEEGGATEEALSLMNWILASSIANLKRP